VVTDDLDLRFLTLPKRDFFGTVWVPVYMRAFDESREWSLWDSLGADSAS
jgi:hypothetical protein